MPQRSRLVNGVAASLLRAAAAVIEVASPGFKPVQDGYQCLARGREAVGHLPRKHRVEETLAGLLALPGRMTSRNRFCLVHDDLALLRADWILVSDDGETLASGSSVELVRRQADGFWRYVIDHAVGASLPPLQPPLLLPPPLATSASPSRLPGVARR